jgi:predicted RNase H-like HicB family nuclease
VRAPKEDRFEIDIFWSDDDDTYIAVVPDIPSCTAWGDTYEVALREIRTAIQGNIEVAREFGHPIPQPKLRQIF